MVELSKNDFNRLRAAERSRSRDRPVGVILVSSACFMTRRVSVAGVEQQQFGQDAIFENYTNPELLFLPC